MEQLTEVKQSTKTDDVDCLLRNGKKTNPNTTSLLRRLKPEEVFSKKPKESGRRHFVKAYAYRIYTSAWVTPVIAMTMLWLKDHYRFSNTKAAFLQGGIEFIVKPFTYALFEWGAAHVKFGYRANGMISEIQTKAADN